MARCSSRLRPGRHRDLQACRARAHRRLRHELSRRRRGALLHRADLQDPVLGRDRERIPLSQSGGAEEPLFVTISQSGETADTLAALRLAKQAGYLSSLAICNVPESSLVRESELVMLTRAGPEIGVASTKAFTTQLAALCMLVIAIAKHPRRRCGARARPGAAPDRDSVADREDAGARSADRAAREALRRQAPRAVPRPRRCCIRSRWKAR
jgi:hypothetical protein